MAELLTVIYLAYSFIAIYFSSFFILIYLRHRNEIFIYKTTEKNYSLSIVVPCYNGAETIAGTIESLLKVDYKHLKKIIVVDDCSTDNSFKIIREYARKNPIVMAVQTPKNTGKASGAKNYGARLAGTELIGFVDADSYPEPESIGRMVGFFDNPKVGGVTASVLVKNPNKFLERLQDLEYRIIAFARKLLGFVDAIYVTPGPLAIYRKKVFDNVGGFDEKNLTEDIEIVWNMISKGYKIEMSASSRAYTVVPDNFRAWYKQRVRWNIGGLQTINKYKKSFLRQGILGLFILPFFILSWIIGVVGLGILFYRVSRIIIINYLATKYSIQAQTTILTLREANLTPSVLFFFGTVILILGISFTLFSLSKIRGRKKTNIGKNAISFLFFALVYLLAYPLLLIASVYKIIKRKKTW